MECEVINEFDKKFVPCSSKVVILDPTSDENRKK